MLPATSLIFTWIGSYRYWFILPLSIVEGPIITIIAGFLSSLGQLSFFISFFIVVLGDVIGDSLWYLLGRYSRTGTPLRWLRFLGVTKERVIFMETKLAEHPEKIFSIGKVAHGPGAAVLFAAGMTKFPFRKFFFYNLIITLVKSMILLLIGFYFGYAYLRIKEYLDYSVLAFGVLFIALYIWFLQYTKSYLRK